MTAMKPLSSIIGTTLRQSEEAGVLARKAARAARVKTMWKEVVIGSFPPDSPAAGIVLFHTNSVYIIYEDEKKTARKRMERSDQATANTKVLIVYVDESIIAAELNARREMVKLKFLEKFGEKIDEFRICVSRGKYKESHPYKEQEEKPFYIDDVEPIKLPAEKLAEIEENAMVIEDDRVREALKRAMVSDLQWKMAIGAKNSQNHTL